MRLVDRDVLDADAGLVAVDLDDPVDEQKRIAVRQRFQDLQDVHRLEARSARPIICSSPGLNPPARVRASSAARFACLCRSLASKLAQRHLAEPLAHRPRRRAAIARAGRHVAHRRRDCAAICGAGADHEDARRRRPARRAATKSPSVVEPEMPTCATMTQWRPIVTLWPIWTRLSILVPSPMTVSRLRRDRSSCWRRSRHRPG